MRVSRGQRQRLALARALYADATWILLDEATSSLDSLTEAAFLQAVRALGKTVLHVSHRLSTLQDCDRIHFLEHGRLLASGSFAELQRECAPFRELLESQRIAP